MDRTEGIPGVGEISGIIRDSNGAILKVLIACLVSDSMEAEIGHCLVMLKAFITY